MSNKPAEPAQLTLTLSDDQDNQVTVFVPGVVLPQLGASGHLPALRFGAEFGADIAGNTLALTVRLAGQSAACAPLQLQLYFDPHLLSAEPLLPAQITTTEGWTAAVQAGDPFSRRPSLIFSRVLPLTTDGGPCQATFTITQLKNASEASTAGSVTVVALNAPDGLARAGIDLPVRVTGLPTGALEIAWAPPSTGQIIITRSGAAPETNQLCVRITNSSSTRDLIDLDAPPTVGLPALHFSFRYADLAPGYGALCTRDQIEQNPPHASLVEPVAGSNLAVVPVGERNNLSWSLPLRDGEHALLQKGGSIDVRFDGLVCDLPLKLAGTPDTTELVVRWENIPSLPAGETALTISKEHITLIYDVVCDPPQCQPLDDLHRAVKISWRTKGAARSCLAGDASALICLDNTEQPHQRIVGVIRGGQVFQILAFADMSSMTPSTVSSPIVFSFKDVSIDSFIGVFEGSNDTLVLVLTWRVHNADHCYLASKPDERWPPWINTHRIPQPSGVPQYDKLFLEVNGGPWTDGRNIQYKPRIGDPFAGGIVFALSDDGFSGWVVNDKDLEPGHWDDAMAQSVALRDGLYAD